jgi:hypothetical protein
VDPNLVKAVVLKRAHEILALAREKVRRFRV